MTDAINIFVRNSAFIPRPKEAWVFPAASDKHHIQGAMNSSIYLGLEYEGELISVMSFGKPRKSEEDWELYRFASSCSIIGGASKLFSAFLKMYDPSSIMSMCDRRWGTGNVYEQLGFVLQYSTKPGYWWVEKYKVRHYRSKFNKQRLIADGFDPSKTEVTIMRERNYDRIWDCGHLKYVWRTKL